MGNESFSYKSFIKNVYIELPKGYIFKHRTLENSDDHFLGRLTIQRDFLNVLMNGQERGAYLVTGYRGMGKTSFVRQVINSYKKEKKELKGENALPVKEINISLAQTQVRELDILKYIVNQLADDLKNFPEYTTIRRITINKIFSWGWPIITILLIGWNYIYINSLAQKEVEGLKTLTENLVGLISLAGLLTLLVHTITDWLFTKRFKVFGITRNSKIKNFKKIFEELTNLQIRCSAQITSEDSLRETFAASATALFRKDTKTYPIASAREIESFLIPILKDLKKFKEYIFIFDELDKIESSSVRNIYEDLDKNEKSYNETKTYLDDLRERRHLITNILSALKFFINEADARFIFIAGREMFEASLADISDRQSSISSIFHRVIYVDSFLKDSSEKGSSSLDIGTLVESFLEKILLPDYFIENTDAIKKVDLLSKYFLYQIFIKKSTSSINKYNKQIKYFKNKIKYIEEEIKEIKSWTRDTHWARVYYLIFKKFIRRYNLPLLIKELAENKEILHSINIEITATIQNCFKQSGNDKDIHTDSRKVIFVLQNFIVYLVYRSNGSPRKMVKLFEEYIIRSKLDSMSRAKSRSIIINPYANNDSNKSHEYQYLYFPYFTQYKLGFNSYLFQPLLTMYSSFIKRYSDNTLISVPYLIDNLIKFHSTAFSIHNLELIPEILSTNKSPISRPFLEELVNFLGKNHIRRTEAGIFEYKFYDKTHNEIVFISKIFEDEAAAYNFTLDENYPIKQHLMEKIKLLRSSHKEFENKTDNPVSSIIYLNRLLGDVRFQDEEYEDAIISYQDAIQMISRNSLDSLNLLISFIRIKLKLGLTYEKIKAYEFALGHYSGVIEECNKQLVKPNGLLIEKSGNIHLQNSDLSEGQLNIYRELMFFILQAHMAILYLQEKLYEGITFQKINYIYSSLSNLINQYKYSYENRDIILASACNNIGTVLYYKNITPSHSINKILLSYSKKIDLEKINPNKPIITQEDKKSLRESISNAFPQGIDKKFILKTLEELIGKQDTGNTDSRVSSTSIIYYKYALQILLGVRKAKKILIGAKADFINNELQKDTIVYLLKQCPALIYKLNKSDRDDVSFRSSQHRRYLTSIGHTLSKIGDAYLPLIQNKNLNIKDTLGCFWYSREEQKQYKLGDEKDYETYSREKLLWGYYGDVDSNFGIKNDKINEDLLPPRFVLHIYYLSSLFFLDAGDTANGSFQLRKILFSLRAIQFNKSNGEYTIKESLKCLENNLVRRILELSSWMSHSSDRPQLAKFKKNFNVGTLRTPHSISHELYANVSNNSETKEAILSYTLLKIQYLPPVYGLSLENCSQSILESKLVSPYNSISHQISRMMELELQADLNYKILTGYFQQKIKLFTNNFNLVGKNSWESTYYNFSKLYDLELGSFDKQTRDNDKKQLAYAIKCFNNIITNQNHKTILIELSQLVVNSIFNLIQVINICNTYGISYIVSYSYLARCHQKLGFWLKFLHLCRVLNKEYKLSLVFDDELRDLVGNQSTISLDTLTHYQIALQYYYNALQMHKEGDSYSLQTNNMLYLEDDFNGNLYHFGAALERLKINSGSIRTDIERLKKEINKANMHKYSAYTGEFGNDTIPPLD